jgi:hypothetical protein
MLEMSPNQKALQKVNDQINRGELLNQTAQQFAQQRYRDQRSKNFYDMFVLNEGNKPQVYKDSKGNRTIGIGFNLEDAGNRKFLKESGIDINELFNGRS